MPYVHVQTSFPVGEPARDQLLTALSSLVARTLGKPEQYVMVSLSQAAMRLGGEAGPAAFCDVRSIGGLSAGTCNQLSSGVCALLKEKIGVTPDRVFLNFAEVEAGRWGWNGETFG